MGSTTECAFISCWILLSLGSFSCGNYPLLDVDTNMRIVLVPHDAPVGTIIYRLRATDSDNNFPLDFEVLGSLGKSLLSLEFLGCSLTESLCQADVILNKAMDLGRTYEFQLRVRDTTGDFTKVPAVITATEGTAFAHSFFGPKILYVTENTPVGTQLEKFTVLKNELNSRTVLFEMREPRQRIELKQKLLSNNRTEGRLLLKKTLDFESEPWFTFQLLCMNGYTNATVDTRNVLVSEVIVAVVDSQDTPPFFTLFPTSVEIPKTLKPGDLVTRVSATDGDKQNKRLIRYGFLTEANPFVVFFDLDPMTGEIKLKKPLSELSAMLAKPNEPIKLAVLVEEIVSEQEAIQNKKNAAFVAPSPAERTMANITFWLGSGTLQEPPYFSKEHFIAEMNEGALPGTPLEFTTDPRIWHESPNELVRLSFGNFDKTYTSALELVPREGKGNFSFEIRVSDGRVFDYEAIKLIKIDLVGVATSSGLKCVAELMVHIRDANDHHPVFSQSEYTAEIPEHSPRGTKVVQVHATDQDTGNYGHIIYSNLVGSDAFYLDPNNGQITVEKPFLLDREIEPEIRLYVEAKDGGNTDSNKDGMGTQRNIGTSTVIVKLTDINDNAPTFVQKYYQAILTPDLSTLKQPLQVKAYDLDQEDTPNSQIRYQLGVEARGFYVDPVTGDLRLRTPYIQTGASDGPYLGSIKVKATDLGSPQKSGEAIVQLFSEDMVTREIQFVLPSNPDSIKRETLRIEKMLSSLTGGIATIQNVLPFRSSSSSSSSSNGHRKSKSPHSSKSSGTEQKSAALSAAPSDQSLVTAVVQFPVTDTPTRVDLTAWHKTYMGGTNLGDIATRNGSSATEKEVLETYRAENRVLFWILIIFILFLIILFAVFLCCIYCPCCWLHGYCKKYELSQQDREEGPSHSRQPDEGMKVMRGRRMSLAPRRRKIYPDEPDEIEYEQGPNYRREAWSGDDGRNMRGGGQQFSNSRRYPPRKVNDVGVEDWEFNNGENRGDPRAEEIGPRWQNQQRRVNYAGSQHHPGDDGYGRQTASYGGQGEFMNERSASQPQSMRGTQNTGGGRFYRTENGEVLQLDGFEGRDEHGKDLLMRRFIDDQDPNDHQRTPRQKGYVSEPMSYMNEGGYMGTGGSRPNAAFNSRRPGPSKDMYDDYGHNSRSHHKKSPSRKKNKSKSPEKKHKSHKDDKHKSSRSKSPKKSRSHSRSRDRKDSNPLTTENLLLATSYLLQREEQNPDIAILSPSSGRTQVSYVNKKEEKVNENEFLAIESEADEDSGIGINTNGRNKMLEKKSVFTIAYDDMATAKALRPDTALATDPESTDHNLNETLTVINNDLNLNNSATTIVTNNNSMIVTDGEQETDKP